MLTFNEFVENGVAAWARMLSIGMNMSNALKLISTIGMFTIPPFVFGRLLINPRIKRWLFAFLSS